MAEAQQLLPVAIRKDGDDVLLIDWSDGHKSRYAWTNLRSNCPCAACRDEHMQPADPFRILKPSELAPLKPVSVSPVGYYGYRIAWSDGHDSGIYTLEHLRELCQCEACTK